MHIHATFADLYEIIEKSDCSADDVERFSTTLNYLIDKCGYTLKATKPSLLHRYILIDLWRLGGGGGGGGGQAY